MRYFLFVMVVFAQSSFAADYDMAVCDAYDNDKDRQQCIADVNRYRQDEKRLATINREKAQKQAKTASAEKCINSRKCIIDKYFGAVEASCSLVIQRMAKYSYEWTNGWTGFKFRAEPARVGDNLVVRFYGDKLRLQNGFGAWSNTAYSCDVDLLSGQIVDVDAWTGRL